MKVIQAYRFALDLTPAQDRSVLTHAGAARMAHNWALARVKTVMDQRTAERSYGVVDEMLTPVQDWSLPALRKAWNAAKREVAPWWAQASKEAFNTGIEAAIRVEPDRMHIVLPRLGRLKLHESARKLARRIEAGTARIMSATVRRDGGRWHVSFTVEVERAGRPAARPDEVVGVDVGIKHLAVLSTGELVANPRHLVSARSRLRALSRAMSRKSGPDRRTGQHPSNRWQRVADRLGRAHARVANLRRDQLHKLTTGLARNLAALAATYDTAGSGSVAGRGADQKTRLGGQVAVKRQPGTASAVQTGTIPPQGGTTDRALIRAH